MKSVVLLPLAERTDRTEASRAPVDAGTSPMGANQPLYGASPAMGDDPLVRRGPRSVLPPSVLRRTATRSRT